MPWEDDSSSVVCRLCSAPFSLFRRRHPCRRCGRLTCDDCSQARMELASPIGPPGRPVQTGYRKPVRVCDDCVTALERPHREWSAAEKFHQFLMLGRMSHALGNLVASPAFQATLQRIWFHVRVARSAKRAVRLAADGSTAIKVVLLGSAACGAKTSFIHRFVHNVSPFHPQPTIGADYSTKQAIACKWELWDTAGNDRYRPLAQMYYRGSIAAIVGYDILDLSSFLVAESWLQVGSCPALSQACTSVGRCDGLRATLTHSCSNNLQHTTLPQHVTYNGCARRMAAGTRTEVARHAHRAGRE